MLHLLKLCVGVSSLEDLEAYRHASMAQKRATGEPLEIIHTTRMIPRRMDELLDGGSLYWVIKGQIQARQKLLDIRPFKDAGGISRCDLVMDPKLIATQWHPKRAFQGWRYLKPEDAPADLGAHGNGLEKLPPKLRGELSELGLL